MSKEQEAADLRAKAKQQRKLTDDQVREIRRRRKAGDKTKDIAADFNISLPTVTYIAKRRYYNDVPDE